MKLTQTAHNQLITGIEELVYEVANEHLISGEALYTVLQCYSEAKLAELAGKLEAA